MKTLDEKTSKTREACVACGAEFLMTVTYERVSNPKVAPATFLMCGSCGTMWSVAERLKLDAKFKGEELHETSKKLRAAFSEFEHALETCLGEATMRPGTSLMTEIGVLRNMAEADAARKFNLRIMREVLSLC